MTIAASSILGGCSAQFKMSSKWKLQKFPVLTQGPPYSMDLWSLAVSSSDYPLTFEGPVPSMAQLPHYRITAYYPNCAPGDPIPMMKYHPNIWAQGSHQPNSICPELTFSSMTMVPMGSFADFWLRAQYCPAFVKVTNNLKMFFIISTIYVYWLPNFVGKNLCEVSISVEIKSSLDTRILVILAFLALIPSLVTLITPKCKTLRSVLFFLTQMLCDRAIITLGLDSSKGWIGWWYSAHIGTVIV